jgi:hypothetical protein
MRLPLLLLVCVLGGCGTRAVGDSSSDTDETGSTSSETSMSSTSSPTTMSAGETTSGPGTTVASETGTANTGVCEDEVDDTDEPMFDVGPTPPECDLFDQDCDEGSKCVPDDSIGTRRCVPIEDPAIPDGEACTSSIDEDPCGPLSWCRRDSDDGGTCVPMCAGAFGDPLCPEGLVCIIDDEQIVAYCDVPCDPFDAAACGPWTCQPTPNGLGCLPGGSNVAGAWCAEHDSCVDGSVCADLDESQGCCHGECCAPICDDAHPCFGGGCTPLVPPVPGAPDLGYCLAGG